MQSALFELMQIAGEFYVALAANHVYLTTLLLYVLSIVDYIKN